MPGLELTSVRLGESGGPWQVCTALDRGSGGRAAGSPTSATLDGRAFRPDGHATRRYQARLDLSAEEAVAVPWPTWRAALRVPRQRADSERLFSALVSGLQEGPPSPESAVTVTMVVAGPRPAGYPKIGDEFTLWRGADVAHGVITR
jgi:hypothetical protein